MPSLTFVAFSLSQSRFTLWIGSFRTRVGNLEPQSAKLNIDSMLAAVSIGSSGVGTRFTKGCNTFFCNTRHGT